MLDSPGRYWVWLWGLRVERSLFLQLSKIWTQILFRETHAKMGCLVDSGGKKWSPIQQSVDSKAITYVNTLSFPHNLYSQLNPTLALQIFRLSWISQLEFIYSINSRNFHLTNINLCSYATITDRLNTSPPLHTSKTRKENSNESFIRARGEWILIAHQSEITTGGENSMV